MKLHFNAIVSAVGCPEPAEGARSRRDQQLPRAIVPFIGLAVGIWT